MKFQEFLFSFLLIFPKPTQPPFNWAPYMVQLCYMAIDVGFLICKSLHQVLLYVMQACLQVVVRTTFRVILNTANKSSELIIRCQAFLNKDVLRLVINDQIITMLNLVFKLQWPTLKFKFSEKAKKIGAIYLMVLMFTK